MLFELCVHTVSLHALPGFPTPTNALVPPLSAGCRVRSRPGTLASPPRCPILHPRPPGAAQTTSSHSVWPVQADDERLLPKKAELSDGATKGGSSAVKVYLLLAAAVVFAYLISTSQGLTVQDLYAAAKQWIDALVEAEVQDAETSPICDDGLMIPGLPPRQSPTAPRVIDGYGCEHGSEESPRLLAIQART